MSTDAHGESVLVPAVDLSQLEERLSKLVDAYRGALRAVSRLPRFGKLKTVIVEISASGAPQPPQEQKRRVVRAFVQLFVEAHIRVKIDALIELLQVEAISLKGTDETKKIEVWIKRLRDTKKILLGWGRYYRLLTKIPLLSVLLPLLGAFLLQTVRGVGWRELLSPSTLILLFYIYVLVAPIVIRYGFRCKRAIFCGGKTVPVRLVWPSRPETELWKDFPKIDIYDAENELFEALRKRKSREFPLDLVFSVIPYVALVFVSWASFDELQKIWAGHRSVVYLVGALGAWLMVAFFFYSPIKYYRQRRDAKKA